MVFASVDGKFFTHRLCAYTHAYTYIRTPFLCWPFPTRKRTTTTSPHENIEQRTKPNRLCSSHPPRSPPLSIYPFRQRSLDFVVLAGLRGLLLFFPSLLALCALRRLRLRLPFFDLQGFDRLVAILCKTNSIRDVIAFPKTGGGLDPLFKSPSPIPDGVLAQYGIRAR